jgi:hypothetical protein
VDNGEEFGGKSWLKVRELRKLISGFGCRLIQNHKGHCEENAHLERSHRTDDDEFYIPRILTVKGEADLLDESMGYIYYYDNVRAHSALNYQTPFSYLKAHMPDIDDKIRFVIPIMLDRVSVQLGPWSGYHVLAQHLIYGLPRLDSNALKLYIKPSCHIHFWERPVLKINVYEIKGKCPGYKSGGKLECA